MAQHFREFDVAIVGKGSCWTIELPDPYKFGKLKAIVVSKFGLVPSEANTLVLRRVSRQPAPNTSSDLFDAEDALLIELDGDLEGVQYIVGKIGEPAGGAAAASGAGGVGSGALTRADLEAALHNLSLGRSAKSYQMSKVSQSLAARVVQVCALGVGGRLGLPDLSSYMPDAVSLLPFQWGALGEEAASEDLNILLESWVKSGAEPPIENLFYGPRSHKSHSPIELDVEDVGIFKGVPDLAIAHRGIGRPEAMLPLVASTAVSVDWKSPRAMDKHSAIAAIGEIHALALAHAHDFKRGAPVFMTDMTTGFRCWLVAGQSVWYLHPDDRDFTLAEGVALVRYFLVKGAARLVPHVRDGGLVFVPAGGIEMEATAPSSGAPLSEMEVSSATIALPGSSRAPSAHKGGTHRAAHAPSGLVSGDVSPERDSAYVGDDMETVVAQIAQQLAVGGGFPRILFSDDV